MRIVFVVVVSILAVVGMSFAIKKFGRGYEVADPTVTTRYAKYASYGGTTGLGPGSGCNSSGCSFAGGKRSSSCCSGSGGAASASLEKIRVEALNYYSSKYGDGDVACEVKDYGCHQEAEIIKDGVVVKKLSHSGGRITEI